MTSLVATFTSPESSSESAPRFNLAVPSTKSPILPIKKFLVSSGPHQLRDFVALPLPKSVPGNKPSDKHNSYIVVGAVIEFWCLFRSQILLRNGSHNLFRLLLALYVLSTSVLAYNPGSSWRSYWTFIALKGDGTMAA